MTQGKTECAYKDWAGCPLIDCECYPDRQARQVDMSRATNPNTAVEQLNAKDDGPDYNDGKWHGWNGGECALHPETVVQWVNANGGSHKTLAGTLVWNDEICPVIAFRVTKPYVEPKRETVTIAVAQIGNGQWVQYTALEDGTHRITFDTIDGEPDPATIKMEKLT